MQASVRPPPCLTWPQEPLMAAWQALCEEPKNATLCVAGAATIRREAALKTRARETRAFVLH